MGVSWQGSIPAGGVTFAHVPANLVPVCSSLAGRNFRLLSLTAERGLILPKSHMPRVEAAVLPASTQQNLGEF